jgi:hypothetical protein
MKPHPLAIALLADAVRGLGPGYANAADSLATGTWANIWTVAALAAIEKALAIEPDDVE